MGSNEDTGIRARWAGTRAYEVPQEQTIYDSTTALPVRRAGLFDDAGRLLLWVWTDDRSAAGSLYASPPAPDDEFGRAQRRAKRYVFTVLTELYMSGRPAFEVLESTRFHPDYRLGTIEHAPDPSG